MSRSCRPSWRSRRLAEGRLPQKRKHVAPDRNRGTLAPVFRLPPRLPSGETASLGFLNFGGPFKPLQSSIMRLLQRQDFLPREGGGGGGLPY